MSKSKASTYSKTDDAAASRDERLARLKFELREHIRFLNDFEFLTADWLRMAESLHQIANVAFMETHLPPQEDNPLTQQGKKDQGTLWDQERDELAVRILLEEGKLNLCLRILHKYRLIWREEEKYTIAVKAAATKFNTEAHVIAERCRIFEKSLGLLLRFAFLHVESLQIMDLPEFIIHISEVLTDLNAKSQTNDECKSFEETRRKKPFLHADFDKVQDTLIIYYLSALAAKIEDMDEDRVMDLMEQYNILPLFITHISNHFSWYHSEALEQAAKFLSNIFTAEAFTSERSRFLPKDILTPLVSLKYHFVSDLVATFGVKKKDVQTLLDEIARAERSIGLDKSKELEKTARPLKNTLLEMQTSREAEAKANPIPVNKHHAAHGSSSSSAPPLVLLAEKKA